MIVGSVKNDLNNEGVFCCALMKCISFKESYYINKETTLSLVESPNSFLDN